MYFLGMNADAKTRKGSKLGVLTGIMYLAPANESGINVCFNSTPECRKLCLWKTGRGRMPRTRKQRIDKTKRFFADIKTSIKRLKQDVNCVVRKAEREGMTPAIRFNGTSDLPFETLFPMEEFPGVQFYDYTKNPTRMKKFLERKMPANYHLTFSLSETNKAQAKEILLAGGNVAVVFNTKNPAEFPSRWEGFPVINGDETDVRFYDNYPAVVGLKLKGRETHYHTGGFVQPI